MLAKKDTYRTLQNSGEELVSLSYPIYNMFNKPGELKVLFEGLVQLVVRYDCAYFWKTYAKHYESHSRVVAWNLYQEPASLN